jgi:protein-L-isoaspartate(D-aspartate) O-methyltransferase
MNESGPGNGKYAIAAVLVAVACTAAARLSAGTLDQARAEMVHAVQMDVRATGGYIGKSVLDARVMAAMGKVARHEFVGEELIEHAYANRPVPIGYGQTISQPYIVALMTDLLGVSTGDRVLEVGTGSGYQAAILAELVDQVFTIEIIEPLGVSARKRLRRLGYENVSVRVGDGYYGWKERAPYDAVIVTAASGHIPPELVAQLKPGGRMAIPIGTPFVTQQLTLVQKRLDGKTTTRRILPVRFVPLTGAH